MDEKTAKLLSEMAKRKRGVLLKDIPPEEFGVAVDYVQDQGMDVNALLEPMSSPKDGMFILACYLKYASKAQAEALASRLTHARKVLPCPQGKSRPVILFNGEVLRQVLTFLVGEKNAKKYWNWAPDMIRNLEDWRKA